jgi:hypothetical protein
MRAYTITKKTPRQRRFFALFVCFVDNQMPLPFIRENPCSSVAKKTLLIRGQQNIRGTHPDGHEPVHMSPH